MDPDQTAPFLRSSLIRLHTVCLKGKIGLKSLQEYSADDINRRHFQMQIFWHFKGLIKIYGLSRSFISDTFSQAFYFHFTFITINNENVNNKFGC